MTYPKVSIVILNWNGASDTIECLESLRDMSYPNYEVTVVDNASEGDDVRILRERFGDYVYMIENDRNYGFAEGSNTGIRYALENLNPDYVWLLNNDTVVNEEALTELVKTAESDKRIAIVGPKVCSYMTRNRIDFAGGMMNWLLGFGDIIGHGETDVGQFDQPREVDYVTGSALLIKTGVVREIGLLDTRLFLFNEDVDWCLRAKKGGHNIVYTPGATVFHKHGASIRHVGERAVYYSHRNRILLMSRHATKRQLILAFLPMFTRFIAALGYYLAHGKLPWALAICRAYYDGIVSALFRKRKAM